MKNRQKDYFMNNDRFKFRVWSTKHNCYQEYCSFDLTMEGRLIDGAGNTENNGREDLIIEQCTGLKDKNGNLIYTGDKGILTVFGGIGPNGGYVDSDKQVNAQVEWVDECAGFYFVDDNGIYYDMTNSIETFEIVGNIHERKDEK